MRLTALNFVSAQSMHALGSETEVAPLLVGVEATGRVACQAPPVNFSRKACNASSVASVPAESSAAALL